MNCSVLWDWPEKLLSLVLVVQHSVENCSITLSLDHVLNTSFKFYCIPLCRISHILSHFSLLATSTLNFVSMRSNVLLVSVCSLVVNYNLLLCDKVNIIPLLLSVVTLQVLSADILSTANSFRSWLFTSWESGRNASPVTKMLWTPLSVIRCCRKKNNIVLKHKILINREYFYFPQATKINFY